MLVRGRWLLCLSASLREILKRTSCSRVGQRDPLKVGRIHVHDFTDTHLAFKLL